MRRRFKRSSEPAKRSVPQLSQTTAIALTIGKVGHDSPSKITWRILFNSVRLSAFPPPHRGLAASLDRGKGRIRFSGLEDMQEPRYRSRLLGVQQKLLAGGGAGVTFHALEHPGFDASKRAGNDVVFRHNAR